jgi:hypothetical protein
MGTVQGKPAARRGRKARDLLALADRPAAGIPSQRSPRWVVDANLARRTEAEAPQGDQGTHHGRQEAGGNHVNDLVRSQALRVLLALVSIGCSAIVLEAGRRWS